MLCADLHLKETEKDYSLSVLREIVAACGKENCGALLFAGDVFDSRPDAQAMRSSFRAALDKLPPGADVYFLPGNHEELRAGSLPGLESFDFGRARLLSRRPFSLETLDEYAELLALPFQRDYSDYRGWDVPPKKKPLRIVLAHGTVPGISYSGPDEEEAGGVLDADLFARFGADLAALGHLHGFYQSRQGEILTAYPGSARIWREGEAGPRRVLLFSTEERPPRLRPLTLASAGEYRFVPLYAAPDGSLRKDGSEGGGWTAVSGEAAGWRAADWIRLDVSGVVEDETAVTAALVAAQAELEKKYRRVSVSKEKLFVLEGISSHPLARRFLEKWEEVADRYTQARRKDLFAASADCSPEVYNLARLEGLRIIKEIMEGRK
jgi:DNA repair exonuclease SbcCD nuclease subunit